MKRRSSRGDGRGQILVLFVLALVAIIAMTGLVLDGSSLLAQQRVAQNAADSAATAGTLVVVENLGGETAGSKTNGDVYNAVSAMADVNGLAEGWVAEYTDHLGVPNKGVVEDDGSPIPAGVWGVRVSGSRGVATTFSRVIGFDTLTAAAAATVLAGPTSTTCTQGDDPCSLLPITFPVHVSECDEHGVLQPGGTWIGAPPPGEDATSPYWPIVGAESLPSAANPTGDLDKLAILPLCKGSGESTGAYGFLDFDPHMNLADEITGPLDVAVEIPDWFQIAPGDPNSVDDEISRYLNKPVLIPLHNQACRESPPTDICPDDKKGVDPTGNNTWYYVHTVAVFYLQEVDISGSNVDRCASAPGSPLVPVTHGAGFLGCLKGWFVKYVTSGPINPDPNATIDQGSIAIQLIH